MYRHIEPAGAVEESPRAGSEATLLASMRLVDGGSSCEPPLFRLVRIRLSAGSGEEEHLVRVEGGGSRCLSHDASCDEARQAAESFLRGREARFR